MRRESAAIKLTNGAGARRMKLAAAFRAGTGSFSQYASRLPAALAMLSRFGSRLSSSFL
ncbi:MAG: hypothetical protein GMKNLPBB_01586 [Myxococcota bacterium]|nr:hypothetical protein [Myxococcota bacterium]